METKGLRSPRRIELNAAGGPSIFQRNFTKMNRSDAIDSYLSLDENWRPSDYAVMLLQPYRLYIERTDKARNMARFYAMTIEPDLFGEVCLIRRWGRIGAQGQMMVQHFSRERDAVATFLDLLRRKRSRGYRVTPLTATVLTGSAASTILAAPKMAETVFQKCTGDHRIA